MFSGKIWGGTVNAKEHPLGYHAQKVGASAFVTHKHCHFFTASPCWCDTAAGPKTVPCSPGPSFSFMKDGGSENDTDSCQFWWVPDIASLPDWLPCRLQAPTSDIKPYRNCWTSSHNCTWSKPQNKEFIDYIYNHMHIDDTYTRIYILTYVSILGVLFPDSLVELWLTQLTQIWQKISIY